MISPLLSNVYLHEVLDEWFEHEVKPRLRGRAFEVRYADDAVLVFEHEDDARRVMRVLAKRLGKYGLRLHPEKTRMVEFCRPSKSKRGGSQRERSFAMLGFTHYWGRSRKGRWVVKRKTAKDRFSRALREIGHWCRTHRHWPMREQWAVLSRKLRGHYAYYGLTGNYQALHRMRHETARRWHTWLNRRHRRRSMTWERFLRLSHTYPLPPARVRAQCVPSSSDHCLTSRVPELGMPGSVGAAGGQPPAATRPAFAGMTTPRSFPRTLAPAKAGGNPREPRRQGNFHTGPGSRGRSDGVRVRRRSTHPPFRPA